MIDSLSDTRLVSQRRELENIQEAINNLAQMQALLVPEKQSIMDEYLKASNVLKTDIAKDIYGLNRGAARQKAESLRRRIGEALQYKQVKDALK